MLKEEKNEDSPPTVFWGDTKARKLNNAVPSRSDEEGVAPWELKVESRPKDKGTG